jgi:O-antigen/teichoic acid export membrane protein
VLTVIVYLMIGSDSTLPALLIYGLSYFPMLIAVTLWWPLPIRIRPEVPSRAEVSELARFSFPVVLGQIFYILFTSLDVLYLERFTNEASVGVYALAKQLGMIFILNSMGISTVLMPRIAKAHSDQHRKLTINAFVSYGLLSVVVFVPFVLLYTTAAQIVGGAEYVVGIGPEVYAVIAVGLILQGGHSVSEAILMGRSKTSEASLCRFIGMAMMAVSGWLLVPIYGMAGAALAFALGGLLSQAAFFFMILRLRGTAHDAPAPAGIA